MNCRTAAILTLLLACAGAQTPPAAPKPSAAARKQYDEAASAARHGRWDAAFDLASSAAEADPQNQDYAALREVAREKAVYFHLQKAHALVLTHQQAAAAVEFRTALALDPSNLDARLGLSEAFPDTTPQKPDATELRVQQAAAPVALAPLPAPHDFHLRGTLRDAIAQIAAAYGLKAFVANSVPNPSVRLDLSHTTFAEAMNTLHDSEGLSWLALDPHSIYLAESQGFAKIAPVGVRTFYLPWINAAADLNEVAQTVRTLLGVEQATVDTASQSITVRATPLQLDATEQLLLDLRSTPGQVVLEVRIVEANATAAHDLGVGLPDQFTMFALGPLLAQLSQNATQEQQILNLFNSGGLNAVLSSGNLPANALNSLQSISPLLQSGFVTFGGGVTLMGLSVQPFSVNLNTNAARTSNVETALLRADSGQPAELKIGQKYPIINASFSPINLSPAISSVIGNGSFIQPFPSFTYEDLGLDTKLTPHVRPDGGLTLKADITVEALSGSTNNNIPILTNRHLVTEISLANNEPVVIAGLLDKEEMKTLAGLPALSSIPALASLFSTDNLQTSNNQLLLVVTPHIVALPRTQSADLWLPASLAPATAGAPLLPQFQGPGLVPATTPQPGQPPALSGRGGVPTGGGRGGPPAGGGGG